MTLVDVSLSLRNASTPIPGLKEPQVIETMAFPTIGYVLVTAKAQVTIYFIAEI